MTNDKKSLKDAAKSNPTALGDSVSLKAEKSDSSPTKDDQPNTKDGRNDNKSQTDSESGKKSLKQVANEDLDEAKKGNRSMLGDPVSLKAETTDEDPVKDDKIGSITGNKGRDSKL